MSKNYVKAVLDHLPLLAGRAFDKIVLLAIAEYASDETRLAWPSIASLVRRSGLGERAVQYALRNLERDRLISTAIGGQDDRGRNTASSYRLEFDHRGQPLEASKAPPKRSLSVAKPAAPPSQNVTADTTKPPTHQEAKAALDNIYQRLGRRRRPE